MVIVYFVVDLLVEKKVLLKFLLLLEVGFPVRKYIVQQFQIMWLLLFVGLILENMIENESLDVKRVLVLSIGQKA